MHADFISRMLKKKKKLLHFEHGFHNVVCLSCGCTYLR